MVYLRVKVKDGAHPPRYVTDGASGMDLEANENIEIPPKSWKIVHTGLFFEFPSDCEVQIRSRSGLAAKGITVMNQPGTVDSDYRGEIRVILYNKTTKPWMVNKGERIAQAVIVPVYRASIEVVTELSETKRGEKGLGSTGK